VVVDPLELRAHRLVWQLPFPTSEIEQKRKVEDTVDGIRSMVGVGAKLLLGTLPIQTLCAIGYLG